MRKIIASAALLWAIACCVPARAAITLNGTQATCTATSQNTACAGGAVTANSVIGGWVGWASKTVTVSSVTDNCGAGGSSNTYTVFTTTTGSSGRFTGFFAVVGASTNPCTVTVNKSASVSTDIHWQAFAGVNTTTPVDNSGANHIQNSQASVTTATDNVTSTAQTSIADGDAIYGATYQDGGNSPTITQGTGFTALGATFGTFLMRGEYLIQGTHGSQAVTFTSSTASISYITGMMQLQPAAGGGATPAPQLMMTGVGD